MRVPYLRAPHTWISTTWSCQIPTSWTTMHMTSGEQEGMGCRAYPLDLLLLPPHVTRCHALQKGAVPIPWTCCCCRLMLRDVLLCKRVPCLSPGPAAAAASCYEISCSAKGCRAYPLDLLLLPPHVTRYPALQKGAVPIPWTCCCCRLMLRDVLLCERVPCLSPGPAADAASCYEMSCSAKGCRAYPLDLLLLPPLLRDILHCERVPE